MDKTTSIDIRLAQGADAAEMSRLSAELGYPMPAQEMARRIAVLAPNELHRMAVASAQGRIAGWMHVEHRFSLDGGDRAELMGLVVDSTLRCHGVGRALLHAAEAWAASRGLSSLTIRSNAARQLSHPFYESQGYARIKTQHVYVKPVDARP
jgi:GNAT superfamily N-acetyltransferase